MKRIFKNVKADKRIAIGYGASLALLLITYLITLLANQQLKDRTERVDRTYNVILNLEAMLSNIKDAETGIRGYALTRDTSFLEPYMSSWEKTDSAFQKVKALMQGRTAEQQILGVLYAAIMHRFRIFDSALTYYKNGAIDSTFPLQQMRIASKEVMTKIRVLTQELEQDEYTLLVKRDKELRATFASIRTITITSLALTLILVIIGFITYTNENKARKVAMQNIREYQQQLSNRIDELNAANAQLLQMRSMEKFAATGRIARTIAHEIRNPLTNISLASSQLAIDLQPNDEAVNHLFDIIERNSTRINKLISELLQTTKFAELKYDILSVNDLLNETLLMAADRIDLHQVIIRKNLSAVESIRVDKEKMKLAFLNIIINAIEAMAPGKGVLQIDTKTADQKCVVTIRDNGVGMDENTLSKLFEPYFTAKQNGNGLGLANTQNIIFNHNGTIHVESREGVGSTFTITLATV